MENGKVNKGLADYVNHKEMQKNEADGNQRKRDQRQQEESHEVRKKLKNEGHEHRNKGSMETKIFVQSIRRMMFVCHTLKVLIMN